VPDLLARLDAIELRLSAVEFRVGTGPDLREVDEKIAQVRREKESAIGSWDLEKAADLSDREWQLIGERASRLREWAATHPDLPVAG
jgi:ATP-dependent Clp protease ATP-binding subunit ClpC